MFELLTGGRAGLGAGARAIGAALVRRGLTGHRVPLALPPGAGYLRTGQLGFLRNGGLHLAESQPVLVTR